MKKTIAHTTVRTTLVALAALLSFTPMLTSCQQEELFAEDPQYDQLFFSADSINFKGSIKATYTFSPGQTVYAGLLIADDGAYITRADQTWTLRGAGIEQVQQTKSVVAPCGKEPTWSFQAPDSVGEYTVTFKEKYSYSAAKPNGTIFGQSLTFSSKFRVR